MFSVQVPKNTLLLKRLAAAGPVSEFSHGVTIMLMLTYRSQSQHLDLLGVRQPDVIRQERGYGDYSVDFF